MQGIDKGARPMDQNRSHFDESKLSPEEQKALAIAKVQGVRFNRKLKDLVLDVEPDARDEIAEAIFEQRAVDQQRANQSPVT